MKKVTSFLCRSLFLIPTMAVCLNASASTIDFSSLHTGDIIGDQLQFQGIRFLPYGGSIRGEIVATASGNIAFFDKCNSCEFPPSGAKIVFSVFHQQVSLHLGIGPRGNDDGLSRNVVIRSYDANGQLLITVTKPFLFSSGFTNEMTITAASAIIASIEVEAIDPTANTILGISDINIDNPVFTSPDFSVLTQKYVDLITGGKKIIYPITTTRFGGSTGKINFSTSPLPTGLHVNFNATAVTGEVISMSVRADASATNGAFTFDIVGTPEPSAGTAVRQFTVAVTVGQAFTIYGLRDIDFGGAKTNGNGYGTVTIPLSIIRNGKVVPPVTLTIDGVPGQVIAQLSAGKLDFPGNSVGDNSVLSFTVPAGVAIADQLVGVHVASADYADDYVINLHGTCPRNNKDFIIRGNFNVLRPGAMQPEAWSVQAATVAIYRDVSWALDDNVGETFTNQDGNFEQLVSVTDEDTYYAKLMLNDKAGVYLHDSWSLSIWDINSANRSDNSSSVIELGGTTIAQDNGFSEARPSIWQGGHYAFQDFLATNFGHPPKYGDYDIKMWKGVQSPFTFLRTTHWPESRRATHFNVPSRTNNFQAYGVNFHEFGHALRHSVDGFMDHFIVDAAVYHYAQQHSGCDRNNDAFGFNEGWAEFWAKETVVDPAWRCGTDFDTRTEIWVAADLHHLMACTGKTRFDMYNVLRQGLDIIHSDQDYRVWFKRLFPEVDMTKCGPVDPNVTLTKAAPLPPQPLLSVNAILLSLQNDMMDQQAMADSLNTEAKNADATAEEMKNDLSADPKKRAAAVGRPNLLRAQASEALLVKSIFKKESERLQISGAEEAVFTEAWRFTGDSTATAFDLQSRDIVQGWLEKNAAAIESMVATDRSGKMVIFAANIRRQIEMLSLKTANSHNWYSLLKMPATSRYTTIAAKQSGGFRHWWWWLVIPVILLMIILLVIRKGR